MISISSNKFNDKCTKPTWKFFFPKTFPGNRKQKKKPKNPLSIIPEAAPLTMLGDHLCPLTCVQKSLISRGTCAEAVSAQQKSHALTPELFLK